MKFPNTFILTQGKIHSFWARLVSVCVGGLGGGELIYEGLLLRVPPYHGEKLQPRAYMLENNLYAASVNSKRTQ